MYGSRDRFIPLILTVLQSMLYTRSGWIRGHVVLAVLLAEASSSSSSSDAGV